MRKLKRLLVSLMASVMALTSVVPAFADGVNGTGSGETNGTSTAKIVGTLHAYHVNQGFRMSIVNAHGVVVSNPVDFVQYFPENIADGIGISNEAMDFMWGKYRTNRKNDKGEDNVVGSKKYITYMGGAKTDPWYMLNTCLLDHSYTLADDDPDKTKNGVVGITRLDNDYTKAYSEQGNLGSVNGRMYTYSLLERMLNNDAAKHGYENPINGQAGTYEYISELTGEKREVPRQFQSPIIEGITSDGKSGLLTTGEQLKNQLLVPVTMPTGEEQTIVQRIIEMDAYDADGRGNQLSGNLVKMFTLLDPKLDKQYKELVAKNEIAPMAQVFTGNNLRLMIEPICWQVGGMASPTDPYGRTGLNLNMAWYTPYVLYGTVTQAYYYIASNFAAEAKRRGDYPDMPDYSDYNAWLNWSEQRGLGLSWEWGLHTTGYRLAQDEPALGLTKFDINNPEHLKLQTLLRGWGTLGYGVMITSLDERPSGTPTWDSETYPETNYSPGPSPENTNPDGTPKLPKYPSEGKDYITNNKDHKFNIVKFYAEKNPDGTYEYKSNFTREQTIHDININDEPDYKVDNYFTSSQFKKPENQNDSYDVYKSTLPKGTLEGNKAGKITIKATDPDTTLYVRLVGVPSLTIIKYYPDKSPEVEVVPYQPNYDANEEGYVYEEDKQTPDKTVDDIPPTYEETDGTPGSTPNIPVDEDTKTIYIKYDKPDQVSPDVITLHQNELAHVFSLSDMAELVTQTHSFSSKEGGGHDEHDCGGCEEDDDGDSYCPGHPCSWERYIDDDNYSYVISNKENYSETNFIGANGAFASVETGIVDDSGSLGIGGGTTSGLTPNLNFVVYRDKVKDNVTLYPNKNSASIKSELADIAITKEGYTPQTKRVQDEGQTEWYSQFKTNYTYDTNDNTLSWASSCSYDGSDHDSGSWNGTESIGLDSLNARFSSANNVLTKAFLGQAGKGDDTPETDTKAFNIAGKTFSSQRTSSVNKKADIEFYPYISMIYEGIDEIQKQAFVTSTNLSKIGTVQVVDTGVYFSNSKPTLDLTSEQWSTHSRAITGLAENGVRQVELNKSLLPGGAAYNLKGSNNGDAAETWVGVKTYQVTVPDENMEKIATGNGVISTSEGKNIANKFIEQARNVLEHYQIVEWINKGIYSDEVAFRNSSNKVLVSGQKAATSFAGNSLSSESKYYLKVDGTGANRADIDIIKEEIEQHVWRVQNDVNGAIWITKDGTEVARMQLNSGKNIDGLLVNDEIRNIEKKTKLISNYVNALDIKLGTDRNGESWYTEAFDGVEVVEVSYAAQLGFGGNEPVRGAVLDPRLTGKLDGKSDILNFDKSTLEEKTRTSQFRTSYRSSLGEAQSKEAGWIGDFNGTPIIVRGMDNVLRSKLFYLGNNTVQDLN